MSDKIYDVAIIGGGLAGMTLACLLGDSGLQIACIDREDPQRQIQADGRTTAVSFGSRKILEAAGIWPALEDRACPIDDIRILDGASPLLLNFLGTETEGKSFGWIVDNAAIRRALLARVRVFKNIDHLAPLKISDYARENDHMQCLLEEGGAVKTRLVVGADGRNSFTRAWMGVRIREKNYHQRAIICVVAHEHPHHNVAVEHFWPSGPFAILPMTDRVDAPPQQDNFLPIQNEEYEKSTSPSTHTDYVKLNEGEEQGQNLVYKHRSSIVFTEHGPKRNSLMQYDKLSFEAALAARFPKEYGEVRMINERMCFPLNLVHAAEYIAPRMVLVADAAHGIHPIAGQGLNLGFRDVKTLAELLRGAQEKSEDVGADALLQAYQRKRRPDNMAMVAVTDGLVRLFSNNIPPVRFLRRAGLRAVSKFGPARRFFMKQAMGDR